MNNVYNKSVRCNLTYVCAFQVNSGVSLVVLVQPCLDNNLQAVGLVHLSSEEEVLLDKEQAFQWGLREDP